MPTYSASNSLTVRVALKNEHGTLAKLTAAIAEAEGNIGAIDIVRLQDDLLIRDVTIYYTDQDHADRIVTAMRALNNVEVLHVSDRTFLIHLGGKIEMQSKVPLNTRDDLSMAYTPGVARVCQAIAEDPSKVYNLTSKRNTVAVVSDGSAVLGLGNIGPEAALPVMEGKAQLFKTFAGVDAWPIVLGTQDPDEIIQAVAALAPGFGGINLEDIAAPHCFRIERELKKRLDIPVFHDDQHGTAVVLVAGLINALRLVGKRAEDCKVVMAGVGAAGTACMLMLRDLGVRNIIGCDRKGALFDGRSDMNEAKAEFAALTNPDKIAGSLAQVLAGADIFIGLSGPKLLTANDVQTMAKDPIVFAMSNPDPEISPEEAGPHVAVMATGRSDYPNQINNVLCFPGVFRGCLDCQASDVTDKMKMAAAEAIASCIGDAELCADYVIPSVFDQRIVEAVAQAVAKQARAEGLARR